MPAGLELFDEEAPQGTPLPYALFSLPVISPEYAFHGLSAEHVLAHFEIYSGDRSQSWAFYEALKGAYDDCQLTIPGMELQRMERSTVNRSSSENTFRFMVTYIVQLQKQ